MALGPVELELTMEELMQIDDVEEKIDHELNHKFVIGLMTYTVEVGKLAPRIVNEIVRRYKAAGWRSVYYEGTSFGLWK